MNLSSIKLNRGYAKAMRLGPDRRVQKRKTFLTTARLAAAVRKGEGR